MRKFLISLLFLVFSSLAFSDSGEKDSKADAKGLAKSCARLAGQGLVYGGTVGIVGGIFDAFYYLIRHDSKFNRRMPFSSTINRNARTFLPVSVTIGGDNLYLKRTAASIFHGSLLGALTGVGACLLKPVHKKVDEFSRKLLKESKDKD